MPPITNALLPPTVALLLLLQTQFVASNPIVVDLELQHPRLSNSQSHRAFPKTVHLFTPQQTIFPSFVSSLLRSHSSNSFSSRPVSVDLLGGITKVGEYYTRITIGGQHVRVQVDTGSSTLALPLAECDRCLPSDQRYNPRRSRTGHARWISCVNDLCEPDACALHKCSVCSSRDACCSEENPQACGFLLRYGDGSLARGALMVDLMSWGSGNVSAPVIFGGILHDSVDFERPIVDGILGMGYEALACNPTCVEPPFQQMVKEGAVDDSFSICITGQGGKLVLGAFDPSMARSNLTYVPLALSDPPTFYTMNVSNLITVGDRQVNVPNLRAGILDSGTTLVVVSETTFLILLDQLVKFHCDVPGLCDTDKPWFMPSACVKMDPEMLNRLPSFTFHLGSNSDFSLELRPEDYMLHMDGRREQGYRCVGIMAMKELQEGTDIIFGNTVMQRYVSYYDRKHKRIGFAEAAEGCGGGSSCASNTQCDECALSSGCSYNFQTQSCKERRGGVGLIPYPECSGARCFCRLGRQAGLTFGVVDGFIGTLLIVGVGLFVVLLYSRRGGSGLDAIGRGGDREPIYPGDDDEDDVYEDSAVSERNEMGKKYTPLPAE